MTVLMVHLIILTVIFFLCMGREVNSEGGEKKQF